MTEAEFHQQQLEQQEQEESIVHTLTDNYKRQIRTHIHADEDTVWLNIQTGAGHYTLTMSRANARQIAQDLLDCSKGE